MAAALLFLAGYCFWLLLASAPGCCSWLLLLVCSWLLLLAAPGWLLLLICSWLLLLAAAPGLLLAAGCCCWLLLLAVGPSGCSWLLLAAASCFWLLLAAAGCSSPDNNQDNYCQLYCWQSDRRLSLLVISPYTNNAYVSLLSRTGNQFPYDFIGFWGHGPGNSYGFNMFSFIS